MTLLRCCTFAIVGSLWIYASSCGKDEVYIRRTVTFAYINATSEELTLEQYDTVEPLLQTFVLPPNVEPVFRALGGMQSDQPPVPFSDNQTTDSLVVRSDSLGCRYFLAGGLSGPINRGDGPMNYVNYEEISANITEVEDIPDTVTYIFTQEKLRTADECE